jgi:hypothetical protein
LQLVKNGRSVAAPNEGFLEQLQLFGRVVGLYYDRLSRVEYPDANYAKIKPEKLVLNRPMLDKVMRTELNLYLLTELIQEEMPNWLLGQKQFIDYLKARNHVQQYKPHK